jgi:hypothetical protein
VIRTWLFDEIDPQNLRQMLLLETLDIYFFDDNSRELLGYQADLKCVSITRGHLAYAPLLPLDLEAAKAADDQMMSWFSLRSADEDAWAIAISFRKALIPEDIFLMDMIPQHYGYKGAPAFSHSQLIREYPGEFQERDIAHLLQRVFLPEQIYINPLSVIDGKEITDLLVVTDASALFIQAKDSPNTEQVMRNSLRRKKTTTQKALTKAINQTRGALRYSRSMAPMKAIVGNQTLEIELCGLDLRALIIVTELFNDEYELYTPPALSLSAETQVPCIPLDYRELDDYTRHLAGEDAFFAAFDRVFVHGLENGIFPRLRIWPGELAARPSSSEQKYIARCRPLQGLPAPD